DVRAGVDEQVDAALVSHALDPFDLAGEQVGAVGAVLDIDTDGACVDHAGHVVGDGRRIAGVAVLEVDAERHADDADDAGDRGDQLLHGQVAAIGVTVGPGDTRAGG